VGNNQKRETQKEKRKEFIKGKGNKIRQWFNLWLKEVKTLSIDSRFWKYKEAREVQLTWAFFACTKNVKLRVIS